MAVSDDIKIALARALARTAVSVSAEDVPLEHPADISHGDYASGVALAKAKEADLSPRQLAEILLTDLGILLPKNQQVAEGEQILTEAIDLNEQTAAKIDVPGVRIALCQCYFARGEARTDLGRYADARADFGKVRQLQQNPIVKAATSAGVHWGSCANARPLKGACIVTEGASPDDGTCAVRRSRV